jgi:Smg protein
MFEVLAFVYQNFYSDDSYPEPSLLQRKLNAVGFEAEEIEQALDWLAGLSTAARFTKPAVAQTPTVLHMAGLSLPSPSSVRVYCAREQRQLGTQCIGYLHFLDQTGITPTHIREVVLERAMAVADGPVTLEDLKLIILMVFWSFGQEPDALALDELCDRGEPRIVH